MTHDPLCTDDTDPDAGTASCCGWCRFAARVRADERGRTLDAARDRLIYVALNYSTDPEFHALAAIDALREETK